MPARAWLSGVTVLCCPLTQEISPNLAKVTDYSVDGTVLNYPSLPAQHSFLFQFGVRKKRQQFLRERAGPSAAYGVNPIDVFKLSGNTYGCGAYRELRPAMAQQYRNQRSLCEKSQPRKSTGEADRVSPPLGRRPGKQTDCSMPSALANFLTF